MVTFTLTLLPCKMTAMDKPPHCPIAESLWKEYRERNPEGLTIPPTEGCDDPELAEYCLHVSSCPDCNEA